MRTFTIPALLAAALFGIVVVIPFLPATKDRPEFFGLEVPFATSTPGTIRVYYDIGAGYREEDSVAHPITTSGEPLRYRLTLPAGDYRSLRFDPIDGAGTVLLGGDLRIVTLSGRTIKNIALSEIQPLHQIAMLRTKGTRVEVQTDTGANDPQLHVPFTRPVSVRLTFRDRFEGLLPRAFSVFSALAALLFAIDRLPRVQGFARRAATTFVQRPGRAIAWTALVAVTLSAYPVLFLGKSYVSPNFGTTLLYEALPTLPSYTSTIPANVNGSDVGATLWHHVPNAFIQRRSLLQGELPLWNRYTLTGVPLLGQGQSMFGDPLHFLVLLCDGAAWAWDLKFVLAKWLFATGLGLLVLELAGRATSLSLISESTSASSGLAGATPLRSALPAALLVTAAAPFMGFFLYRINHAAIFSVSYAPWILYGWCRLAGSAARRSTALALVILVCANVALLNSGTVKEAYLLILQMNLAGAVVLLMTPLMWRTRLLKLTAGAWAGLLVLLLTMPVWATFLQSLRQAFTVSGHAAVGQIQPSMLIGAFDEIFYRPLSQGDMVFNPALNFLLLLGVLYFLATIRLHLTNGPIMAVAVCSFLSAAVVFGVVPPSLLRETPFLANVGHIENCFLCGLLVTWSVLAGVGFHVASTRIRTREGRADLVVCALLLLALVSAWVGFRQAAHRNLFGPGTTFSVVNVGEVIPVNLFVWGSLVALVLASVGFALGFRRGLIRGFGPASVLLIVLCSIVMLWRHGAHGRSLGFETYLLQPPERAPFDAKSPAMDFLRARHQTEPSRVFGMHGNVTPAWNAVEGLEAIYGAEALQTPWLRDLVDVSPLTWGSSWRLFLSTEAAPKARPFLDALNVRFYADMSTNPRVRDDLLPVVNATDLTVYESRTAWPRAFFTDRIETYEQPKDLVGRMLAGDGRPFAALHSSDKIVSRFTRNEASRDKSSGSVVAATDYRLTENTTRFRVRAPGPGLIVLSEAWWPESFQVDLDGRAAPLVRVNHAFKGVAVPAAGDYSVTFSYWPKNFTRYLLLAGVGAVLFALTVFLGLRPARPA